MSFPFPAQRKPPTFSTESYAALTSVHKANSRLPKYEQERRPGQTLDQAYKMRSQTWSKETLDGKLAETLKRCPGLGPAKAASLLESYGTLEHIVRSGPEEMVAKCPMVGRSCAAKLYDFFDRNFVRLNSDLSLRAVRIATGEIFAGTASTSRTSSAGRVHRRQLALQPLHPRQPAPPDQDPAAFLTADTT